MSGSQPKVQGVEIGWWQNKSEDTSLAGILRVIYVGTKCLQVWVLSCRWMERGEQTRAQVCFLSKVIPYFQWPRNSVTILRSLKQNIPKHYSPYHCCFANGKENSTLPYSPVDSSLSVKCLFFWISVQTDFPPSVEIRKEKDKLMIVRPQPNYFIEKIFFFCFHRFSDTIKLK